MKPRITFVVASDVERQMVEQSIAGLSNATHKSAASVVNCGVGFRDRNGLSRIGPGHCLVSTGFAAGLTTGVDRGSVLLPQSIVGKSGRTYSVDGTRHRIIAAALARSGQIHIRPIVEVGRILATETEKSAAHREYQAIAADMESASIAGYCRQQNLNFVALRVVLDSLHTSMPQSIVDLTQRGEIPRALPLMAKLLVRPSEWPAFSTLLRCVSVARRSLRIALDLSLPALMEDSVRRNGRHPERAQAP